MNYRSIARMNAQIAAWVARLPQDLDVVVGVPRSGMLVANLLALHRNLHFTDVDGLLDGRRLRAGDRLEDADADRPMRVLVVDDSVFSGGQLAGVRERIDAAGLPHQIQYAAVYVRPGTEELVDFYCEALDAPRIFEWNMMNHHLLSSSCVDIDGVLCRDPSDEENDDGERYLRFLAETPSIATPRKPIGWLVTSRLEKYRAQTEEWLARHGVRYRELVMLDLPDKNTRVARGCHGEFKAHVYAETGADLFIESSIQQATRIATITKKPVICTETRELARAEDADALAAGVPASLVGRANVHADDGDEWTVRSDRAVATLLRQVPNGSRIALIDDARLGLPAQLAGRTIHGFPERDGVHWGAPSDDSEAELELDRQLREHSIDYVVMAWPAFWWRESYPAFEARLHETFEGVHEDPQLRIFKLRRAAARV